MEEPLLSRSASSRVLGPSRGAIGICLLLLTCVLISRPEVVLPLSSDAFAADGRSLPAHLGSQQADGAEFEVPAPVKRCRWVIKQSNAQRGNLDNATLRKKYHLQVQDPNMYYRGVAFLFWQDFVGGGWGHYELNTIKALGSPPVPRFNTWTWITGDQHLSNFGAWKNRHGDVLFGVNDFDEAVVYDFQVDVYRLAVSIYAHAVTNGFSEDHAKKAVKSMTDAYVTTVRDYVGNEKALLYEITSTEATGRLRNFLQKVINENSQENMLRKFTSADADGSNRHFVFDKHTRLEPVDTGALAEVRKMWNKEGYGATLQHIGWHALAFDNEYFKILDMAKRVDSGDGSFGTSRYYLLIAGTDALLGSGDVNVILDLKATEHSSARQVLRGADLAWYTQQFPADQEARRAVWAQRRLTSYVDPFTGWIRIFGQEHVVRQRSPWKDSPEIKELDDVDDYVDFVRQTGIITATSHTRGSIGHSPAQFKEVVGAALGSDKARDAWGERIVQIAAQYRQQVLLDYECFCDFVRQHWP